MFTQKGKYDLKLLHSINDFYSKKSVTIESSDNIIIKYLKNHDILKESKDDYPALSLFIKELLLQIENNNNIILPFIEPIYDLIEIYINSKNNKIHQDIWEKIFVKLIENTFFNKENLLPIYSFFTELYSEVDDIEQSDEKINKFKKVTDLWKLLYLTTQNKIKTMNSISSFCFLGTGLEIYLLNQIPDNICINIKISFITEDFLKYVNLDDSFIEISDDRLKYKAITNITNIKVLSFQIKTESSIRILLIYFNNIKKGSMTLNETNPKVTILKNFFGQIKNIKISLYNYSNNKELTSKEINPYPIKNNGGILFSSSYKFYANNNAYQTVEIDGNVYAPEENKYQFYLTIKVSNSDLFKVNYINSKENGFDMMNYLGGIVQLLPFLNIINGLYNNKKIQLIENEPKGKILFDFAKNILLVIFNYVNNNYNKEKELLDNYWTFFLYVINKVEPFKNEKIKIDLKEFDIDKTYNIYSKLIIGFLKYISAKNKEEEEKYLENLVYFQYFNQKGNRTDTLNFFWKTNGQLYRHIMKELFIYNRLWSKQYLFFNNVANCYQIYNKKDNKQQIKYKRLNYYTANFQQPFIYPILEINNYIPKFTKFKIENLYKNKTEKIISYDFSLDKHKTNCLNDEYTKQYLDNDIIDISNSYCCCLVKRMYHVKGRLFWLFDKNDKNIFKFYFLSNKDFGGETCNKKDNSGLCYGSIFPFLEKEKNRIIFLPKEKIVFAIIRIYYQRISGLEIFTRDNKSYYFNFKEEINKDNLKGQNSILSKLKEIFKPIKIKNCNIIGWYNPDFEKACFPLFSEDINIWKEKHIYSNFDKLMIINLFSSRTFHDLDQYPIFPMFYNEINNNLKRTMNKPIGFQEIDIESKNRTQLIQDSYFNEKEYGDGESEELSYFSVLPSNTIYVCNYLIRVFPYSYVAIEVQGNGFDAADRLFFSIKSTMLNTLTQRSDLRELIPEFFYFSPLFKNINNFELNKLSDGSNIDNVYIQQKNENKNEIYIFLRKMKNILEKEEKLNQWIDLMFGINKEFNEKKERYYKTDRNVEFKSKPELTNDDLTMKSCDFGVLPLKLFNEPFPVQNIIPKDLEKDINNFNYVQSVNDHIYCLTNEIISFICVGEKGINSKYFDLINKTKNESFFRSVWNTWNTIKMALNYNKGFNINYLFIGDVFGNLSIYKKRDKISMPNLMSINNDFFELNLEKQFLDDLENKNYILLKQLNDHSKEILYIDYNPRLNLLADFSMDGFINIYSIPTFKLIRAIQTKDLNMPGKIYKIALISNPFPMLCCVSTLKVSVFDINGNFIRSFDKKEDTKVEFSVDKNCGRVSDYVIFSENKNQKAEYLI